MTTVPAATEHVILPGPDGGETGALLRTSDWSSSPLGHRDGWPKGLHVMVEAALRSSVPMVLICGDRGVLIYNDGYARFAGARHPEIFGMPAMLAWPEVASWNAERIADFKAGRGSHHPNQVLRLERGDGLEETFLDLHYSPFFGADGTPLGAMCILLEQTERVRLDRRLTAESEAVASLNRQIAAERDGLRRMFQRAPGFMALLHGPRHVFRMANEAYLALVGHRDLYGRPVTEALPEVVDQGFIGLLDQVYRTGKPYVGSSMEVRVQRSTAGEELRIIDFVYQPTFGDDGEVEGVFVQGHDVTERQQAFAAVRESEARFRLIADSAPVPMWVSELGGKRRFVNHAYLAFLGTGFQEAIDFDWRSILHPEDHDRIVGESIAGEASLKLFKLEARYRRGDGAWRWLQSISQPRWGPEGRHAGFVGVAYDITDSKDAAERQSVLINELNHRVKNSLATVQSLAAQSIRPGDDAETGRRRFERRLMALAKAHDVLTRRNWDGAEVNEIAAQALRPYDEPEGRVSIEGPALRLAPDVALAVSMILHELATNAAKYGALSTEGGTVAVAWSAEAGRFELTWRERGGPPVTAPLTQGFGSRLIERQAHHALCGHVAFDFRPDGLVCTVTAAPGACDRASLDSTAV